MAAPDVGSLVLSQRTRPPDHLGTWWWRRGAQHPVADPAPTRPSTSRRTATGSGFRTPVRRATERSARTTWRLRQPVSRGCTLTTTYDRVHTPTSAHTGTRHHPI